MRSTRTGHQNKSDMPITMFGRAWAERAGGYRTMHTITRRKRTLKDDTKGTLSNLLADLVVHAYNVARACRVAAAGEVCALV